MSEALWSNCSFDVVKEREGELFDGNVFVVLWEVEGRIVFVLGDKSGIGDLGFWRAVRSEIDDFPVMVDDGIEFFLDFYLAILWRLVLEFWHGIWFLPKWASHYRFAP